ncbi:MAG: 4-hydroxy-tetrahydrodipicolinate reductase [Pseudomonadota bacterium]
MKASIPVAVLGLGGRMGQAVVSVLASTTTELQFSGGWCRDTEGLSGLPLGDTAVVSTDLDEALAGARVAIDFTLPEATARVAAACERAQCALVTGVTGLTPTLVAALDVAAQSIPVLHATNMSAGAHLLMHLAGRAAAALDEAAWDAEVLDVHHRDKRDAPSGTALSLGEAIASARGRRLDDVRQDGADGRMRGEVPGAIGFTAQRGGGVVGEHTVSFLGNFECVELKHRATDRRVFADGALRAARWIAGRKPGRYTMQQVLGLS